MVRGLTPLSLTGPIHLSAEIHPNFHPPTTIDSKKNPTVCMPPKRGLCAEIFFPLGFSLDEFMHSRKVTSLSPPYKRRPFEVTSSGGISALRGFD